jgi:hypothetical protein
LVSVAFVRRAGAFDAGGTAVGVEAVAVGVGVGVGDADGVLLGLEALSGLASPPQASRISVRPAVSTAETRGRCNDIGDPPRERSAVTLPAHSGRIQH